MKHVFFATVIITLALIAPAYFSFIACVLYLVFTRVSPIWLLVLGVLLDSMYGHRFAVFGYLIPLYTALATLGFLVITAITKRISYIS